MYAIPLTSLHNIFFHSRRQLSDENLAYKFITGSPTNDIRLNVLLESLDSKNLNEETKEKEGTHEKEEKQEKEETKEKEEAEKSETETENKGMEFNGRVVYGSSETTSVVMKTEDYLFNHILRYQGFYEMPTDLFETSSILEGFCSMRINALRNQLRNQSFKLKDKLIKKKLVAFRDSLNDNSDVVSEVTSFFARMQSESIEIPRSILDAISKINFKIERQTVYYGIINIILEQGLWIVERRQYSYSVIRRINDMLLYDDGVVTDMSKKTLLDSLNKPLVASRRLLLSSVVDSDLVLNGSSLMEDISTEFTDDGYSFITISGIHRKLHILPKPDGKQFGFKLRIENISNGLISNFFVKSYMGYYSNAVKFSGGNDTSSSPVMTNSQESRSMSSTKIVRVLDLKEPFMYNLLSKLGFSPEVHFIINPYITGGFFIATADLNDETKREKFFEIGHIAGIPKRIDVATGLEDENVGFVRLFDIELRKQSPKAKKQAVFVELTKVDMLARIFRLEDFNTGNFGCIVKMDELKENKFTETCLNTCDFKVIDFYTHSRDQKYIDSSIGDNFMKGNTTIAYSDNSIMARALKGRPEQEKFFFGFYALQRFQSRLDKPIPHVFGTDKTEYFLTLNSKGEFDFVKRRDVDETDDEFMLEQTLVHKNLEIKSLMLQQRGTDDKPEEIMLKHPVTGQPRTNAELIGFKIRGDVPRPAEEPLNLEYIEDAFEDLDNYCQGIMCNYKTLKRFITNGYHEYFDGQGNPRVQPASAE